MKKHSINIEGHSTSITLEDEFWAALKGVAAQQKKSVNEIITQIDRSKGAKNLSSAIRVYILKSLSSS